MSESKEQTSPASRVAVERFVLRRHIRDAIAKLHAMRYDLPSDRNASIGVELPLAILKPHPKRINWFVNSIQDAVVSIFLNVEFDLTSSGASHKLYFNHGFTNVVGLTHQAFIEEYADRFVVYRCQVLPYSPTPPRKKPHLDNLASQLIPAATSLTGHVTFDSFDSINPFPEREPYKKPPKGRLPIKESNYESEILINALCSSILRSYSTLYDYTSS